MGHPQRIVLPGDRFHIIQRGIAHRTVADNDIDGRGFCALLADLVHRGEIKVLSFCLLMTHFHLLIECLNERLGDAMRRLEGIYARGFNRRRPSRDGALLRARYRAKRVRSEAYQSALFRYLDFNPVVAGLVKHPFDYPFGSACLYARRRGPPWLDRTWAEAEVCRRLGIPTYTPEGYSKCFGVRGSPGQQRWLESVMASPLDVPPTLDAIVAGSPRHISQWMDERALEADGSKRQVALADPESAAKRIAEAEQRRPDWILRPRGMPRPAWKIMLVGMLRDVGGQTFAQIAARTSIQSRSAMFLYAEHQHLFKSDEGYRAIAVEVAESVVRECHGTSTSLVVS